MWYKNKLHKRHKPSQIHCFCVFFIIFKMKKKQIKYDPQQKSTQLSLDMMLIYHRQPHITSYEAQNWYFLVRVILHSHTHAIYILTLKNESKIVIRVQTATTQFYDCQLFIITGQLLHYNCFMQSIFQMFFIGNLTLFPTTFR